jgi:hypothetical protein
VAKAIRKSDKKRRPLRDDNLPLKRENFIILGAGLLVILAGYLAMLEGSVEGFLPLVVAPILLVFGYCFVIPFGILYRKKEKTSAEPGGADTTAGVAQTS